MKSNFDVAIVGAGPYGLSTAAHLRKIPGLNTRVFGETMSFWERHMPAGMLLRSPWSASHIADPKDELTLDAYVAARGNASWIMDVGFSRKWRLIWSRGGSG